MSFLISDAAIIEPVDNDKKNEIWFNINYPQYHATIYCSYLPVDRKELHHMLEDSYKLAFSHASKADGIKQSSYSNDDHKTSAILYDIEGQVAVPVQFFVTDSTANFFRGSLYYNGIVNPDSVAPVTGYLREDIIRIIETLKWKN